MIAFRYWDDIRDSSQLATLLGLPSSLYTSAFKLYAHFRPCHHRNLGETPNFGPPKSARVRVESWVLNEASELRVSREGLKADVTPTPDHDEPSSPNNCSPCFPMNTYTICAQISHRSPRGREREVPSYRVPILLNAPKLL